MKRSPIALALVAALGVGLALPSAPAFAQDGASMTVQPIRTGSSSIGGAFGVRLAVYDRQSFELSWNRIPNATTYRLQVGDRTVQENGAVSRYVSGVSLAGGFDYTLTALDRSGSAVATQRFRVQPASGTQLVAAGGTTAPTNPTAPVEGPGRPRDMPQAPQGLRAQVYSSSAGEVFWNRIPGAILSYEVRLGGQVVATTNGTSYFIGNRPGLSDTRVEVVAIGTNGRRSSASSATLGGGTASNPTTPTNPMAPVAPTTPVAGPIRTGISNIAGDFPVRLAVYDAQSFELSWHRVPGAATYRLSRGGQVVQESNGLSRYVSGINRSASFAYTLVALDRAGTALRSTSFTVAPRAATQLVAGGGTSTPTTPANPTPGTAQLPAPVASRLTATFRTARGDALETAAALTRRLVAVADAGSLNVVSAVDGNTNRPVVTYDCPRGGTVVRSTVVISGSSSEGFNASACAIGPLTINGSFGVSDFFGSIAGSENQSFSTSNFTLADSRNSSTINVGQGTISTLRSGVSSSADSRGLAVEATNIGVVEGANSYGARSVALNEFDRTTPQVDGRNGLTLSITELASSTISATRVETTTPFRRTTRSENYRTGTLRLSGASFTYELNADNGDPATFTLTVQQGGATTSYTVPWSMAFGFDGFDTTSVDLGF